MTDSLSNNTTASQSLQFDANGGLFGASDESLTWDAFLGIGADGPATANVNLGGPLNVWLPFKGETEVLRLELAGQIATRMGLDLNLEITPGTTQVSMPYNIDFKYPDAETLAANPFFRLEGFGEYDDNSTAGFATEWPRFVFTIDAIFELAVLMNLVAGVLGDNETYKLLDFDVGVDIPIVDLDTKPDDVSPVLFGLEFGENAALELGLSGPGAYIENPTSFKASLSGSDIKITAEEAEKEQEEKDPKGEKKDDTDDKVTATDDKKNGSLLDALDISAGDLATLTLNLPDIELADRGEGGKYSLDDLVSYLDGTRPGDFDGTHDGADARGFIQDLALLEIDLDDIAVEAIKRAFTGGVGVPNTPGLEGSVGLNLDAGPFGAGVGFSYNLIDADLEFSLPINQTVEVTPQKLQTQLSFYKADVDGTVQVDADGAQIATWMEARLPRFSVYFNESNSFWNEDVAEGLREAMQTNSRAAEDIGRFVDFASGRIPGAFTGQTGSISGGVVMREEGSTDWVQLSTNPEETEYLARTRPDPGGDPQLSDIRPRNNAEFRYVIYDNSTVVSGDVVNLATAVDYFDLDFGALVGPDGIFEARLDVVTAPISSTGLVEGVPSIDFYYPNLPNESIWAEVSHRAAAEVRNDTSLDFEIDFVLTALELQLEAYLKAFGATFGLDFSVGPMWEKTFPLFATELTKLYDDTFTLEQTAFSSGDPQQTQQAWGFAIGAGGPTTVFADTGTTGEDLFDGAAVTPYTVVDGLKGRDTLSLAREEDPRIVDLQDNIVATPGRAVRLGPDSDALIRGTNRLLTSETYTGDLLEIQSLFAISWDLLGADRANSDAAETIDMQLQIRSADGSLAYAIDLSNTITAAEGEVIYFALQTYGQLDDSYWELYASTGGYFYGTRTLSGTYDFGNIDTGGGVRVALVSNTPGAFYNKTHTISEFMVEGGFMDTRLDNGGYLTEGDVEAVKRIPIFGLNSIENVTGGRGADELYGSDGRNTIEGGEGDDTIDGRGGADSLVGGVGNDILITGGANGSAVDIARGGEGDDRLVASAGRAILDGGEDAPVGTSGQTPVDLDIVDYRDAPDGIVVNLSTGARSGPWIAQHQLIDIEGIAGTAYRDVMVGDSDRSYFEAGDGNDVLFGDFIPSGLSRAELDALDGGNDRLYGQGGNDRLIGGPGADMLDGGTGQDLVDYSYAPTSVFVDLADGEVIDGEKFAPLLQGTGSEDIDFWRIDGRGWRGWAQGDKYRDIEKVRGTDYEDIIFGDDAANVIVAGKGDDRLSGRGGQDTLNGEAGDDIFWTASSGLAVGITYNPEDDSVTDTKHFNYSLRNAAEFDTSRMGGDIDVVNGGYGSDLQFLDWNGQLELVQDNILHEVYGDGTSADIAYQLSYNISLNDNSARIFGDLETMRAGVEVKAGDIPNYFVMVDALSREGGDFVAVGDFGSDPAEFFEAIYGGYVEGSIPTIQGGDGSYFRHTTNGLSIPDATFLPIAQITSIEGFVGSTKDDVLLGSGRDDSLYGAGGADIVWGADGGDILSVGVGQSPQALFSFPGRGIDNITPFSDRALQEGAAGDLSSNAQAAQDNGTSVTSGGNTSGGAAAPIFTTYYFDYTYAPMLYAPYAALIEAYRDGNSHGRDGLETLRADLAAVADPQSGRATDSTDFLDFAMVDGGDGIDTLDLRHDRGISFLPDAGTQSARVFLNEHYVQAGGDRALAFGIENVVGTEKNDYIVGTDDDNVLEGMGGTDTLQGGGGIDTLSYANAKSAVDVVLNMASSTVILASGSDNDTFSGFEIMRGSEQGDRIGVVTEGGAFGPNLTANAFQLFDGGDGDDRIMAGLRGVVYEGGEGDDRFFVNSADLSAGSGDIVLQGGDGIDMLVLNDAEILNLVDHGNSWTAVVADASGGTPMNVKMAGVEYIDLGSDMISLESRDPGRVDRKTLSWSEDPWSLIRPLDDGTGGQLTDRDGVVTGIPDTGSFQVRTGGTGPFRVLEVGDDVTSAELETLIFRPGPKFGVKQGNSETLRDGALLELEITLDDGSTQPRNIQVGLADLNGAPLRVQTPHDIDLQPISYDIGALIEEAGYNGEIVHLSRLGQPSNPTFVQNHIADETAAREAAELDVSIAEYSVYTSEQAWIEARDRLSEAQQDLTDAQIAYNADPSALNASVLEDAEGTEEMRAQEYDSARSQLLNDHELLAAEQERLAAAQEAEDNARDVAEKMFGQYLEDALPETRLGDDQTYEITEITDGATLWLTKETPAPGAPGSDRDWTNDMQLFEGDVVRRDQLDQLAFERKDGLIGGDDAVSFRPVETLEIKVTNIPGEGVVFSPVQELWDAATPLDVFENAFFPTASQLQDEQNSFTLTTVPGNGTLFYRDVDGARIEVEAGDALERAQIDNLLFDASVNKYASRMNQADLDAAIAAMNTPTVADGKAGEGAAPLPLDASVIDLGFEQNAPTVEFDGVTVNLEQVGETYVVPLGTKGNSVITNLSQTVPTVFGPESLDDARLTQSAKNDIVWKQWTLEEGGNGHFYGFQALKDTLSGLASLSDYIFIPFRTGDVVLESYDPANAATSIDRYVNAWNSKVVGSNGASIQPSQGDDPLMLASVGSAAENDFIYNVFADIPGAISGIYGPRLGGENVNGDWVWDDGSDWNVAVWAPNEPNNGGGDESTLHYALTDVPGGDELKLPTWNDVEPEYNATGFIIEAATLATARNDHLIGSMSDDFMDGGNGEDSIQGGEGNDTLRGGEGHDTLVGGAGDDTLSGNAGFNVFVMERDAGTDVVIDYQPKVDRIDVSRLGISSLSELRVDSVNGDLQIHAKGSTLVLQGYGAGSLELEDFAGMVIRTGALVPAPEDRALAIGDVLNIDELEGLRFRASDDFNGTAGTFEYEVLDPWYSGSAQALMANNRNGSTEGRVQIDLAPVNDAPRAADRAYLVSADSILDARDPGLALSATDAEGDPLTFGLVEGPQHGTLSLGTDGGFIYRPVQGFVGDPDNSADDSFVYSVSDGVASSQYRVSLDVQDTSAVRRAAANAELNDDGFIELGGLSSNDVLAGHDGPDHIDSTWGDDNLFGQGGDDSIEAGAGQDTADGGTGNDTIRGGEGEDRLLGASGDDELNGDAGADTMNGGPGSDLFFVDDAGDIVLESYRWAGHDTVVSAVSFRMGRQHIEDLTLTGDAVVGAGNGIANRIVGNDQANTLDGGKGVDTLVGGAGNDTYLIRSPGDTAVEFADEGLDTVKAFRDYKMEDNIERLFMQTVIKRDGTFLEGMTGIGNGRDNVIVGNVADNFIGGRAGNDTLTGNRGDDAFLFAQAPGAENADVITDFNTRAGEQDTLRLLSAAFGGMAVGQLDAAAFHLGRDAADVDHRFIFDASRDALWFDADGNGILAQQLVATFSNGGTVSADDIFIV